jgi:hypothetical protein
MPSSLSKNRKESIHLLRPELVETLTAFRRPDAKPEDFVFRGLMPRVPTFKGDLASAGIPFEDARGRRIDIHALRKTFGTLLAASGVSPRVAMELMRHSDMKLTMGVYTDVTTQESDSCNPVESVALGHEKAPAVTTGRLSKMERAKRLELIASLLQACLGKEAYESLTQRPAHAHAHGENHAFAEDKLAVWAEELHEIIAAWPSIGSNLQNGLTALVRSQKTPTLRP